MANVLKSNLRSVTTVALLNLIVAHVLFLPTIPFRIDYYVRNTWDLPGWVCIMVSSMIHVHMYLSFFIYVAMLILRFNIFFKKTENPEFHRKLHSLGASAAVWAVFLIGGPVMMSSYGKKNGEKMANNTCFDSGYRMKETGVRIINYVISLVFITIPIALSAVQAHILLTVKGKYGASSTHRQEFWAQMKSLNFVLIMLVCFVPYHMFRLYYLSHSHLESQNEIFLAMTALSCIDLLTLGRGACHLCGRISTA